MDPEFLKFIASMGVGGVLAWGMFLLYRRDANRHADDLKGVMTRQAEDHESLALIWKNQSDILMRVVQENTSSNVKLENAVVALRSRLDHDASAPRPIR